MVPRSVREMDRYSLRFAAENQTGEKTVAFHAHSTAQALDLAKESASGDWAELYLNGKSVCKMQLVGEDGVWFVQPTGPQELSDTANHA